MCMCVFSEGVFLLGSSIVASWDVCACARALNNWRVCCGRGEFVCDVFFFRMVYFVMFVGKMLCFCLVVKGIVIR